MRKYAVSLGCIFLLALLTQAGDAQAVSGMQSGVQGAMIAIVLVGAALICSLLFKFMGVLFKKTKEGTENIVKKGADKLIDIPEKFRNDPDPQYYAQAEEEISNCTYDKGLWSKALVNAKGSEDIRKAEYIKLRARQLQKEAEHLQKEIENSKIMTDRMALPLSDEVQRLIDSGKYEKFLSHIKYEDAYNFALEFGTEIHNEDKSVSFKMDRNGTNYSICLVQQLDGSTFVRCKRDTLFYNCHSCKQELRITSSLANQYGEATITCPKCCKTSCYP